MKNEVQEHKPKHKAVIEPFEGCKCLIVDGIIVPHCDCGSHGLRIYVKSRV